MNKSVSSGQIGTRMLPPPPPLVSRSTLYGKKEPFKVFLNNKLCFCRTIQNSVATDNVDHSHMFPPQDEFAQFPPNTNNQDTRSIPSQSTSESKQNKKKIIKKEGNFLVFRQKYNIYIIK